jgi:V/A-type H+-transporting ATPase subunit A
VDGLIAPPAGCRSRVGRTGAAAGESGRVRRVSGPLVEVGGLAGVAMYDVVLLGPAGLPGEVVAIRDGVLSVQAYEYTGGLGPDDPVISPRRPLSARLGPGLLGRVFDGLLRPLSGAPDWLSPGAIGGDTRCRWRFEPAVGVGADGAAGDVLGTVAGAGAVQHRVLVPPGLRGRVDLLHPAGEVDDVEPVATVAGREVGLTVDWPVRQPRPFAERLEADSALLTGQRVIDTLFPLARGSTAAVPGGFGTGKTVLLQQVAKWCDADVIVYVGCGERGNEMADTVTELGSLSDPRTGGRLLDRTVVIANTSNMPMMAREASIYTGVTVAEYYRDMGYHAVVIADSTSRWAEALRELASRSGALPAEEGYPATLASALAGFYQRAGQVVTLGGRTGSVTVIGAVSPPGGDLTEPVTANTERFVRAVWTLDRDLAYARHYPAVGWTGSFSRDADLLGPWHARHGDPAWARRRGEVIGLLAEADRLTALAELLGVAALPGYERMVLLAGRLLREGVLQQSALSPVDAASGPAKSAALTDTMLAVVGACQQLVDRGVPAATIEEVDFGPVLRAREEAAADDVDAVWRHRDAMLATLDLLGPRQRT